MERTPHDLYAGYEQAVAFFNDRIDATIAANRPAMPPLKPLSFHEFQAWWPRVSEDCDLKSRWLSRFENPERSLESERARISDELNQVLIRRAA